MDDLTSDRADKNSTEHNLAVTQRSQSADSQDNTRLHNSLRHAKLLLHSLTAANRRLLARQNLNSGRPHVVFAPAAAAATAAAV